MIFRIPRLIEHISSIMTLEVCLSTSLPISISLLVEKEGDLILTGTPSGVGPVEVGDKVECLLADPSGKELASLDFTAVAREGGYRFNP